ncbi:MAG: hypothetical protein LBF54_03450 [Holosporaceae bacterium]|jgi:hypothetical protein|nr:hypothetical protein [Holosporaceae bacterium]
MLKIVDMGKKRSLIGNFILIAGVFNFIIGVTADNNKVLAVDINMLNNRSHRFEGTPTSLEDEGYRWRNSFDFTLWDFVNFAARVPSDAF